MSDVALVLAKIFLFVKHWKKLHNCQFSGQKAGYSIIVSQTVFARVQPDLHNYLLNAHLYSELFFKTGS